MGIGRGEAALSCHGSISIATIARMRVDADESAPVLPPLRWGERAAVVLLLGLFVVVGVHAVQNLAFIGQDFHFHLGRVNRMFTFPDDWFAQDVTNRPLIYWIALGGMRLTANRAPFEFAAGFFLVCNAGALGLMHDSMRRWVSSPALRVAALALVAFLPVTVISAVAFAADAMAMPLFALLGWSLLRLSEADAPRSRWGYAALAGLALSVGQFAKFTFIVLPLAVLVVGALLWRWGRIKRAHAVPLFVAVFLFPALVGGWLHFKAERALAGQPARHSFEWRGTGEMTWRSLLLVKASDVRILDAPAYWDFVEADGKQVLPLLAPNSYSYPALLHLGVFTDVLDLANLGSTDRGVPRPQPQKLFSQRAVRMGLLFSVPGFCAVVIFIGCVLGSLARPSLAPPSGPVIWGVLGLVWFLAIVLPLPFVQHAYDWGYWLPRLVVPALWSFALVLFSLLDERIGRRKHATAGILALTLAQTGLHVGSVWY